MTVGLVDIHLVLKFLHLKIYLCAASELREKGKKASISFRFLSVPLLHIH